MNRGCVVKWHEGRAGREDNLREGIVVGWIHKGGLDSRTHAVVLHERMFITIRAELLEFVRWMD
jgi:hypothetical protein